MNNVPPHVIYHPTKPYTEGNHPDEAEPATNTTTNEKEREVIDDVDDNAEQAPTTTDKQRNNPRKKKANSNKKGTRNRIIISEPPTADIGIPWPNGWTQKLTIRTNGCKQYEFKPPGGTNFSQYRSIKQVQQFLNDDETITEAWIEKEAIPSEEEASNQKGNTTTEEESEEEDSDKEKPRTEDPRRQFTRRSGRLLEQEKKRNSIIWTV